MKRLLPLAFALSLAGTAAIAQEQRIVETVPTTAVGATTVIGGYTYIAIALGVLVLVSVAGGDSGSSTTGTN